MPSGPPERGCRFQETNGMTELVVFWGRGASTRRSMREPDLPDPAFSGCRGDRRRRRDRRARRAIGFRAISRGRPRRGGRALGVRLAAGLQGMLDLRVLDLELEGAGQWRGE